MKPARPQSVPGFFSDGFSIYQQVKEEKILIFSVSLCMPGVSTCKPKSGKLEKRWPPSWLSGFVRFSYYKYKNNILNYKILKHFFTKKYKKNILKIISLRKQSNSMQAQEITNRIREIMKARRITQNDLAARLHVSQNQISQYLAGSPRLDTLLAIADALQIEPAELFKDTTPDPPTLAACPKCGAPLKIVIK